MKAEVLVRSGDRLGESPLWDGGVLRWLDLLEPRLRTLGDGRLATRPLRLEPPLGAIVPCQRPGQLLLLHRDGLSTLYAGTGQVGPAVANPEGARAGAAWNDAKVAPDGALWLGSYDLAERDPRGALWRMEPGRPAELIDAGFVVSNGPAFAADGTAYFNDSVGRRTLAYRRNESGRWTPEELIRHDSVPDGLTVDAEGTLWIALYGGGAVTRHAPDGREVGRVALPCPNVTSCCFGGPDLATLFVTTAWEATDRAAHPEAGHLFAVATDATGRAEPRFRLP